MKILAQNYKTGDLSVLEAPTPGCQPGGVLVRTEYSLISSGTELMKLRESRLSLVGKAKARPDQVRRVLDSVGQQGFTNTYRKVMNRLDSHTPLGYSLSGIVVEVGAGVSDLAVGKRVACGGNEHALHAEYVSVPRNLTVPVPDGVRPEHAAFATVGSVAMQALRQSELQLGESALIIGLGLLGQLLVQLLRAAGATVAGLDPVEARATLARSQGASLAGSPVDPGHEGFREAALVLTGGVGFDHVFLCVGGDSPLPVRQAADLIRDRGRIVDVGKCNLNLPWKAYYEKELDLRFSRSYGPGRYDAQYELGGVDYPISYVRWTENRNMACFLELLASGRVDLALLEPRLFPLEDAGRVYDELAAGVIEDVAVLFEYSPSVGDPSPDPAGKPSQAPGLHVHHSDRLRVAAIGCGNYGSTMILPHLERHDDVDLAEVVTRTSLSAVNARDKHGFLRCSTDVESVVAASDVDAVLIMTRHDTHAELAARCLRAGKHVFVEKPLALSIQELENVDEAIRETGNDRLMVGFNRRFAPMFRELKAAWGAAAPTHSAVYRVNAGRLADDSWYADRGRHGSRFVGEGGHFIDLLSWWFGSEAREVTALSPEGEHGSMLVTVGFANGAVGSVAYHVGGDPAAPKELFEAYGGGRVGRLENFRRTVVWRGGRASRRRSWLSVDKGQGAELEAFVNACLRGGAMPIPYSSLYSTTLATLAAERSAIDRTRLRLADLTARGDR